MNYKIKNKLHFIPPPESCYGKDILNPFGVPRFLCSSVTWPKCRSTTFNHLLHYCLFNIARHMNNLILKCNYLFFIKLLECNKTNLDMQHFHFNIFAIKSFMFTLRRSVKQLINEGYCAHVTQLSTMVIRRPF